jgi:hypothetical protein
VPPRLLGQAFFRDVRTNGPCQANRPEPTHWITYSLRLKSLSRIKGNFETWTVDHAAAV